MQLGWRCLSLMKRERRSLCLQWPSHLCLTFSPDLRAVRGFIRVSAEPASVKESAVTSAKIRRFTTADKKSSTKQWSPRMSSCDPNTFIEQILKMASLWDYHTKNCLVKVRNDYCVGQHSLLASTPFSLVWWTVQCHLHAPSGVAELSGVASHCPPSCFGRVA